MSDIRNVEPVSIATSKVRKTYKITNPHEVDFGFLLPYHKLSYLLVPISPSGKVVLIPSIVGRITSRVKNGALTMYVFSTQNNVLPGGPI